MVIWKLAGGTENNLLHFMFAYLNNENEKSFVLHYSLALKKGNCIVRVKIPGCCGQITGCYGQATLTDLRIRFLRHTEYAISIFQKELAQTQVIHTCDLSGSILASDLSHPNSSTHAEDIMSVQWLQIRNLPEC